MSPWSRPQCRARGLTAQGTLAGRAFIDLGPGVRLRKQRRVPPTPAGPAPSAWGLACPGRSADDRHSSGGPPPQAAIPRASPDLAFPPPRPGAGPMWLTRTLSCWNGRPSARVPPFLPRAPSWAPGHSQCLRPWFTSRDHSRDSSARLPVILPLTGCLSSPLSPRPQGVPLSEPAMPPRCPSLPPAQESAANGCGPPVSRGLAPDHRPGPQAPSRALSCSGSPASLLPQVPGFPGSPQTSGSPPRARTAHLLSEPPGWPFLSPSHGSITALPSRSHGPAD